MKIVIESPLAGDFVDNFRFALWCCRAVWLIDGHHAIASHIINPWFMDDHIPDERAAGINNLWVWEPGVQHWFFIDKGMSRGMTLGQERLSKDQVKTLTLKVYAPEIFEKYSKGEWPPHTAGFELK
jgi:hypothetical protein